MKRFATFAIVLMLFGASQGARGEAAETLPASPYSGDIWTRSTLSGDWGGLRNDLAAKGVALDMNFTQDAIAQFLPGTHTVNKPAGNTATQSLQICAHSNPWFCVSLEMCAEWLSRTIRIV